MQWLNAGKCVGGLRPQRLLKGCVFGTLRANIWLGCCQLMHGNVTMYEFELWSVTRRTSRMHSELETQSQTAEKEYPYYRNAFVAGRDRRVLRNVRSIM